MHALRVSEDGRFLTYADGTPFFYLADTAWDLFYRLNMEEAEAYFRIRSEQGFNAIQAVLLGGILGSDTVNRNGRRALCLREDGTGILESPDLMGEDSYWAQVKAMVTLAEQYGIYMALLPCWLNKYTEKGLFTLEGAECYGSFLGQYFAEHENIIWVMGGDYFHRKVDATPFVHAIARGLKRTDGGAHLLTFHPGGGHTSCEFLEQWDYVDFHGAQSSHDFGGWGSHKLMAAMRAFAHKPYLDLETRYENHGACWRYYDYKFDAADIRQVAYQNVLEGACGQTYGHASIFAFSNPPDDLGSYGFYLKDMPSPGWKEALDAPGARHLTYLKQLRLSRPYFGFRAAPELVVSDDAFLGGHISAGRAERYAYIYAPQGQPIKVYGGLLGGGALRASWFNPRTGEEKQFALIPPRDALFVPPTQGKDNDWVLILDVLD